MWLFMVKTSDGEEPILLDERETPGTTGREWRLVAEVGHRDEVYALLPPHDAPRAAA